MVTHPRRECRTCRDHLRWCVASNVPFGMMRPRVPASRRGTVLMETVLVLPILTLLIFAIAQFAYIWYAQIMTHYAAYNAARAALVYNPSQYSNGNDLMQTSGPCWNAAVQSLSWVSASTDSTERSNLTITGHLQVPGSSYIKSQVRVSGQSLESSSNPIVCVRVEFDCPLHVPVIGRILAAFSGGRHPTMGCDYVTLHADCIMNKPWRTDHYPVASTPEPQGG